MMAYEMLVKFWRRITTAKETDADAARREHTVKVVLATFGVIVGVADLAFILGWLAGALIFAFPLAGIVSLVFFGMSLWLAQQGYWRIVAYTPFLVVYLAAVYGTYLQGIETGSVLFYLLAVMLASIGEWRGAQWAALILSLGTYIGLGLAHMQGILNVVPADPNPLARWSVTTGLAIILAMMLQRFLNRQLRDALRRMQESTVQLTEMNERLALEIQERESAEAEQARLLAAQAELQQEVIEAQQQVLKELSAPVIPIMRTAEGAILVVPLIGSIDSQRAKDIMRVLLAGISEQRARVVILDITGVPIVDTGIANHLNKAIQAMRLKGARTIVTGISDAVAETIVNLGIDWRGVETLSDLQTGLLVALESMGVKLQN